MKQLLILYFTHNIITIPVQIIIVTQYSLGVTKIWAYKDRHDTVQNN